MSRRKAVIEPFRPTLNLKHSTALLLWFDLPASTGANAFLDWLNSRADGPLSPEALTVQRATLERRLQPGGSVLELLAARGLTEGIGGRPPLTDDLSHVRNLLKAVPFQPLTYRTLSVSVDYFNPRNELLLPWATTDLLIEVFAIEGKWGSAETAFPDLVSAVAEAWPLHFACVGHSSFFFRYVAGHDHGPKHFPRGRGPDGFLWPLTFLRGLSLEQLPTGLPVHKVSAVAGGVLVQTFEEFVTGHEDRYLAAAKALGLRSLWEFTIRRTPRAP